MINKSFFDVESKTKLIYLLIELDESDGILNCNIVFISIPTPCLMYTSIFEPFRVKLLKTNFINLLTVGLLVT